MKKILFLLLIFTYVALPQAGKSVLTGAQRDSIQVMIDASIDTTVTGTTPIRTKIVYVEDYGTDEAAIKQAIDSAGTGGIVEFEPNRTYTQTDGIKLNLYDGLTIRGNGATLKRGAQQVTTLTDTVSQYTTVLKVDSVPSGWEIGDELQIYTDSTVTTSSRVMEILSISGLDITLTARVNTNANLIAMVWNVGDKVRKTYGQIVGAVEYAHHIYDLTFDGNKAQNNGNYYFALNEALWIFKRSTVSNCRFYNMPNENIFGNGMTITGCYAQDLNGSFFHATGQNYYDIDNFYGTVSNCLTYNTNIMPSAGVNGHSEGVITWSATAGRVNIHNNFFFNGGEAVLGYVTWGGDTDGGTRDFVFTDNFCRNFDNITSLMYRNYSDNKPGHFVITNNVFDSCGTNDWADYTTSLVDYDSVHIAGNQLWGGTTWTNLPTWSNIQQGFQTGDIVTEDITADSITSTGVTVANGGIYVWDASVLGSELYTPANAIADTSGNEANATLGWYGSIGTPTLSVVGTGAQTGTYSLKLTATANGDVEGMVDTLTGFGVGQTYRISLWAKAGVTADTISQKIGGWEGFDESPNESVTSSWAQYTYYLTATNDTVVIAIYVSSFGMAYGGSIGDEILIDNLSIQKVQGGDITARGKGTFNSLQITDGAVIDSAKVVDGILNVYIGGVGYLTLPDTASKTTGFVPKLTGSGVEWSADAGGAGSDSASNFEKNGLWHPTDSLLTIAEIAAAYQPLEATLTDIADGTITENLVNTANPWADNEVADNLTIDDAGIASTIARDSEMALLYIDTIIVAVWGVMDTVTTGDYVGKKIENNYTITEVAAYTNSGTITFNIEERVETTPNTAGVDVMTSDLVADTDQQETGTFSNAAIDRDDWLVLVVTSITGDPTVFSVTVRGVKTN